MAILRFYTTLVRHEYITGVTFKSMGIDDRWRHDNYQ